MEFPLRHGIPCPRIVNDVAKRPVPFSIFVPVIFFYPVQSLLSNKINSAQWKLKNWLTLFEDRLEDVFIMSVNDFLISRKCGTLDEETSQDVVKKR